MFMVERHRAESVSRSRSGGLDSIGGAIIGGMIIGLLETFTGGYLSPSLRDVVPYIVLVFILMVKPYGLFGLVEIERV